MVEIIFHGRGGQGAVTASEILAKAAFYEGKYSHAFPFFQGERKGAPVMAYTRISDAPIEVRGPIEKPDIVLILDVALLKTVNPLKSLRPNGLAIINTTKSTGEIMSLSENKDIRVDTIDATALSEKIYGQSSIPRVNVAMLGYFAARTQSIKVDSILTSIDDYFTGDNGVKAKESVKLAYSYTAESK
jgi:2-oxoacid:acceptor oxidoreductase gamma subunit (pyruvate/2-ketoisovalerate family)